MKKNTLFNVLTLLFFLNVWSVELTNVKTGKTVNKMVSRTVLPIVTKSDETGKKKTVDVVHPKTEKDSATKHLSNNLNFSENKKNPEIAAPAMVACTLTATVTNKYDGCSGSNNGSITITPSGGSGTYTYVWKRGATTISVANGGNSPTIINQPNATNFTCTVTDTVTGCTFTTTNITLAPLSSISFTKTNASCSGNDATATVTTNPSIGSLSGTFSYLWERTTAPAGILTDQTGPTATGLLAGASYKCTVTYTNSANPSMNCSKSTSFPISIPGVLTAAIPQVYNISCNGANNGKLVAQAVGGVSPYTYSWSNGATTSTISSLGTGTYTCTIKDSNGSGCTTAPLSATIAEPANPSFPTNINKYPVNNAITPLVLNRTGTIPSAVVSDFATGFNSPSEVIYDVISGIGIIYVLNKTTGIIQKLNADGTVNNASWATGFNAPSGMTLDPVNHNLYVADTNNNKIQKVTSAGVVSIFAGDGTTTSPGGDGSAGDLITGVQFRLPVGIVCDSSGNNLYITDASGKLGTINTIRVRKISNINDNSLKQVTTLTDLTAITSTSSATPGKITVNASGNTLYFADLTNSKVYSMSSTGTPGSESLYFNQNYTTSPVALTFDNDGNLYESQTIAANAIQKITAINTAAVFAGGSGPGSTNGINNSPYSAQFNGILGITFVSPDKFYIADSANGKIRLITLESYSTISPALPTGLTYDKTTGAISGTPTQVTPLTTYTITSTNTSCIPPTNITVQIQTSDCSSFSTATTSQTNVGCNGGSDGTATVTPSSGTAPYTYAWSRTSNPSGVLTGQTTATATGLAAGDYQVTITDDNGCTLVKTLTITEPSTLATVTTTPTNVSCNGGTDGIASITVGGGTGTLHFAWKKNNVAITGIPDTGTNTGSGTFNYTLNTIGAGTYEVTVSDDNGCLLIRTFTIIVEDVTPPTVLTKPITVQLDPSGNISITADQIDNGSTDNCNTATKTLDKTTFNCSNIGANTVTLTVTDTNGNIATNTAIVTVNDNSKPTITAPLAVAVTTNSGCTATGVSLGAPTTSDNCSVNPATNNAPSVFPIGDTTVTWTVTDSSGNSQSATQIVTVTDNVNPIAISKNITAQLDTTGNITITPAQIDNGSTDNCGTTTKTLDVSAFTCANVGTPQTVNLTVTDAHGNTATTPATVTVQDKVVPTVVTQNITVQLDASGNASITVAQINNGSSDACGILSMALDKTSFTCTNVGANTVTLTVTDINNNVATAQATVTVIDNIKPTITAPSTVITTTNSGCTATGVALGTPTTSDNCSVNTVTNDALTAFPVGNTTVTWTVTDVNGNSTTATQTVTVNDTEAPVLTTQNITVQLDATGNVTITPAQIDNGSTDNCTIATKTLDKTTFNCSNVGDNTVTLTVTDNNGNTSSKTATVTVQDKVVPTVVTQNITVQLDATGNATITPAQIDNGSTDNCTIATRTLDKTTFNCSNVGANTVTLTVTDNNGNTSSKTATVTVQDKVVPTVVTQNITVQLDATGNATITPAQIDNGSTDNCTIATRTLDKTTFNCSNVGANTVTLTVTDNNGNTSSKTATVTVQDKVVPTVVTQNITVQLDATGNATITPAQIDNGSTDNCTIATKTLDKTTFNCSNVGANTVTLTVTDNNGNTSSKTATVTVQDKVVPTVVTQNITVQLDATGNVTITPAQIDNGSTDNCTIATRTLDKTTFNCSNVGTNTVTLTVTDNNGNTSSKTATVTVQDKVVPTVVTQNITVQLDATGNVTITSAQIDNGSTDNCTITTRTLDKTTFNCSNVGNNTVTLTVTDNNGNTSSKTATVTVQDKVVPTVVTQNITVQLDATGNVTITPAQIDNGSTDNCTIATKTLDKTTFNCSNVEANTVTLTVTDNNGNTSSKTATVTVQDKVVPTVVTQNITVQLDATGNVTITPAQIDNGSTDNCTIATRTLDKTTFNCSNVGVNTVTLTVTDNNGNTSSKTATVTVQDKVVPTVVTQNITVQLDATGNVTITPAQIDNGSTDNCTIATRTLDKTTFNCSNVGANTVTLTVSDVNGNVTSNTAIVTVENKVVPVVITKNITVQLDASGNATITPVQIDNGSTGTCGIATLVLDKTSFACANVGNNTVTLTLTDNNGNIASNTAIVTIEDKVGPKVLTQNIAVQLDSTGNVTFTPEQINNGSTDSCGISSIALDKTSLNCDNIGENTVVLSVTDINGNVSSATAIVTVSNPLNASCHSVNVSQAITPNGDGVNDTWMVYGIENYPNCKVSVYNQWANEVFFAKGYKNDWNGSYKNEGTLPESGSYYYTIDLKGSGSVDKSGWIYITK